jgi:transposase-like protein
MDERNSNGSVEELPDDIRRWTAHRRAALVLSILRGETSAQEAARKHDLTVAAVEEWKDHYLRAAGISPGASTRGAP